MALKTGMRSGELMALQWTDIDFEGRTIQVSKQWSNKTGFGSTKTQRVRVVPISEDLLMFLKELKLKRGSESGFVLPHLPEWENGDQAHVLRQFCAAIGITPVKFHDLRATFITNRLGRCKSHSAQKVMKPNLCRALLLFASRGSSISFGYKRLGSVPPPRPFLNPDSFIGILL
jgi:integrase